jgi:phosphoribosylamine--glycine ligase
VSPAAPTVCVVGAGAREHVLARALARSAEVVVTPGNPGMPGRVPAGHGIRVTAEPATDVEADLYIVGPEAPLVEGLADRLRAAGRAVVGPGADGARLEGSKAFMKELLHEARIPTARFGAFGDPDAAGAFLRTLPGPWVVKTDGLAAGKGVLVAETLAEAEADVAEKLSGRAFGDAGRRVVIEEGLAGTECSLLALCDGRRVVPLAPAQDFKRVGDADTGPNTGGMGAFSPVPGAGPDLVDRVMDEAVEPLVATMVRRGIDYRGVLYAGLMLTPDGPRVLEYNVRFGDPEAQVVLPRLADDPVELLMAVAGGRLGDTPRFTGEATVCVVMAAGGYPGRPRGGDAIAGLGDDGQLAEPLEGVTVFHAGTARPDPGGPFFTAGGRVLAVTAMAPDLGDARRRAYDAVARISWAGAQHRGDIAADAAAVDIAGDAAAVDTVADAAAGEPHPAGSPR